MEPTRSRFAARRGILVSLFLAGCGSGGSGSNGPCDTDCSLVVTQDSCLVAVCNEGQLPGPVGRCVVVGRPDGTACDDGYFCTGQNAPGSTGGDSCLSGVCTAGAQNLCGRTASTCESVTCDEPGQTCQAVAANEGATCADLPPCQVGGVCASGLCVGSPVDCSAAALGCLKGLCNPVSGLCEPEPQGGACLDGVGVCQAGVCLADGTCEASALPGGTPCNDRNACTTNDTCDGVGGCSGDPVADCTTYLEEPFEACPPAGWTFGPGWECGQPTSGPGAAFSGVGVVATGLAGDYSNNLSWGLAHVQTPPFDLASATEPALGFWAWWNTESCCDGWNVAVSADGGTSFQPLTTVNPPHTRTVNGQPAWGGDASAAGWQFVTGDLAGYVGQTVVLRFAFRSDGSITYPGVYLDDLRVGEASGVPLVITTAGMLPSAFTSAPYAHRLTRVGGSAAAVWSIVGGTNHEWLGVDAATGQLAGTPLDPNAGPASVTVRVEEPADPSNFDEKTFDLQVLRMLWLASFEGACPAGWTLAGNWQCGVPTSGPGAAYSGVQCIGTQLAANYDNMQSWIGADSPAIDLASGTAPRLTWRAWIHTESSFDGTNLKVSTDGGATWQLVTGVTPAYATVVDGESAWSGDQAVLGWQPFEADLSPYAGQQVRLRFAFRSDGSVTYPGVYVDEVAVLE